MMNKSRRHILKRLRSSSQLNPVNMIADTATYNLSKDEKIQRLTQCMTAVRTEVHHLNNKHWADWLNHELPKRNLKNLLMGACQKFDEYCQQVNKNINIHRYDKDIETWKNELYQGIDVGLTTTKGAIAETGSLILWPNSQEPRLMSLVPPVHIALLKVEQIYSSFAEAMEQLDWAAQTPTNALLISGPSKTADIEQTLAYGIHGPKQLIVLII